MPETTQMTQSAVQFQSGDGCVYLFNRTEKRWYKFCPVRELPADVKEQVREMQEKADAL
jgi:hypothetical protein